MPHLEPHVADSVLLAQFAARLDRLTVDRRDPEWFHVERSEISHGVRAIARRMASAVQSPERSTTTWRPPYAV